MTTNSSYRPRNPGHDYFGRGTYLITLVVTGRRPLLGCLGSDATHPEVQLTPLGEAVRQAWEQTPEKQATPGISRGELLMKNECLERGFPLIHIQKEPIGPYWKPERQRFDACANGSLLILAPWQLDQMGTVANVPSNTDYSRFHNLNNLATEVCDFSGNAKIVRLNNG